MFTGIVTDVGEVVSAEQRADLRLRIRTAFETPSIDLGASICCSGVCLTVVDKGHEWFAVDLSTETLSRTANSLWKEGSPVNLERSLRVGDELGGHFVTGHVDGMGDVTNVAPEGGSIRLSVRAPAEIGTYIAGKGSVALDGVSLTVNDVSDEDDGTEFGINIIPHTAGHTTLGKLSVGDRVNLEIDVLARYLKRMAASQ